MIGLITLLGTALVLLIVLLTAMLVWEMRRPVRHTIGYALGKGLPCDPTELRPPLQFEEWRLDRPDGVSLPVWEITTGAPARCHDGTSSSEGRATAVFVHGWGHSRLDVLPRISPFVSQFDRLVMYDLRGHGEATGLSNLGCDEHHDLLALLERLGDSRFVLIGHSMGAVIAIAAAVEAAAHNASLADRISAIVAYAPYCEFHASLRGRLRVGGYPTRPVTDLALFVLRLLGIVPLSLTASGVAQLRCPLIVIHGSDDCVAPIEHGRRVAAVASDAALHEIIGAGHVDCHSFDEPHHDAILHQFLSRLRSPSRLPTSAQAQSPQEIANEC